MSLDLCGAVFSFGVRGSGPQIGPLDLNVQPAAVTALVGPSGSGKSTAVKMLAGLLAPSGGAVTCEGKPVKNGRRLAGHTALLTQHPRAAADPHLTIGQALRLAARLGGADLDMDAALNEVGLDAAQAGWRPSELSGGQVQRAMLARALAQQPRYLLADEATAHLDPITGKAVAQVLRSRADAGMGVLLVTHDVHLAETIADRTYRMQEGEVLQTA